MPRQDETTLGIRAAVCAGKMAETQGELDAFFALFGTFELSRPVVSVSDLSDGAPLLEILQFMCVGANYGAYSNS